MVADLLVSLTLAGTRDTPLPFGADHTLRHAHPTPTRPNTSRVRRPVHPVVAGFVAVDEEELHHHVDDEAGVHDAVHPEHHVEAAVANERNLERRHERREDKQEDHEAVPSATPRRGVGVGGHCGQRAGNAGGVQGSALGVWAVWSRAENAADWGRGAGGRGSWRRTSRWCWTPG